MGIIAAIVFSAAALAAKPDPTEIEVVPSNGHAALTIPVRAIEVAPNVFYLGVSFDEAGLVEGYAIVTPRKGFGKPGTECGNGVCEAGENANKCPQDCGGSSDETSTCYGFLAKGAKWKMVEPYAVNAANNSGLSESFIASNLAADIGKWESAAGANILGDGSTTSETLVADTVSTDGKNEVYFGSIAEPGAIAITIVWGIFGGPPSGRRLVEWDQVYDQADYGWSDSGEVGKMDFENIAIHELGHSVGMGDLYTSECSEQTMYGYADYGETKKRTLEAGDIAGVSKLYS